MVTRDPWPVPPVMSIGCPFDGKSNLCGRRAVGLVTARASWIRKEDTKPSARTP
jgi:hypothetical protein